MSRIVPILLGALVAAGCSGTDEIFLSQSEADALEANFEASLEAQQLFSEFSFRVARGEADISGYLYDAPTAANNWVGTLLIPSSTLPFGTGSGAIVFRTTADGVPVDTRGWVRPALRGGEAVLRVRRDGDRWVPEDKWKKWR